MAKSIRSKFKKKQRAIKTAKHAPVVEARIAKVNGKLHLCAKGGLSKVPMQDPPEHFGFKNPAVAKGTRLKLDSYSTNPHGLTDASRPHTQVRLHNKHVDVETPQAGLSITNEMIEKMRKSDAAFEEDVFFVNGKAASTSTGHALQARDFMKMVQPIDSDDDDEAQAAEVEGEDEDEEDAPQRLKSMQNKKGSTAGDVKIKSGGARQRLISGNVKKNKGVHAKRK
mgnify:CR=1 FL=1